MKVWIISFLVLFGMVEMYQWMSHFTVPLPVYILAGALLAIASNFGKYAGRFFLQQPTESDAQGVQPPTLEGFTNAPNRATLNQSSATPISKPPRSISFTISRHAQEGVRNDGSS